MESGLLEAYCNDCNIYMDEIITEEHGMPNLIRTEPTYRSGGRGRPSRNIQKDLFNTTTN